MDEADDWMAAELDSKHAFRLATAVVWRDRCVVRRWSGLRIEATSSSSYDGFVPWSVVPSALLSAMSRTTPW